MDELFDTFDELEDPASQEYYDHYLPNLKTGWNMFFAFLVAAPITWFIVWVFSREPQWYQTRRFK